MIVSIRSLYIELNNSRYVLKLANPPESLELGIEVTLFIRSINNYKVSSEMFFKTLKQLTPNCILSIYSNGKRIIAEHINSHIHLNIGNSCKIRSNATFIIEWKIKIVWEM